MLDLVEDLDIDFRKQADACGGLVAPKVVADVISRFDGPVAAAGLVASGGRLDPLAVLDAGASLLGFDLRQLIAALDAPPSIVNSVVAGQPPTVTMSWTDVKLQSVGPFIARNGTDDAQLDLSVTTSIDRATTDCKVSNSRWSSLPARARS